MSQPFSRSILSRCLRSCPLYRAGQVCMDCPNRSTSYCPVPDIEDLFLCRSSSVDLTKKSEIRSSSARPEKQVSAQYCDGTRCGDFNNVPQPKESSQRTSFVDTNQNYIHPQKPIVSTNMTSKQEPIPKAQNHFANFFKLAARKPLQPLRSFSSQAPRASQELTSRVLNDAGYFGIINSPAVSRFGFTSEVASSLPNPTPVIPLSAARGKEIFTQALAAGGLENYFPLSEQYLTQKDQSLAGVTSLAMVLNALQHDPQRAWKGPWRWNSEEVVECRGGACGHSLEQVRGHGLDFAELAAMARCKGVRADPVSASNDNGFGTGLEQFRNDVRSVCEGGSPRHMVLHFSPSALGVACGSGSGGVGSSHISPIGGYHAELDLILVLDVARHRSPPFWAPTSVLWAAMKAARGGRKGREGGYVILSSLLAQVLPTAPIDSNSASAIPATPTTFSVSSGGWASSMCPLMIRSWSEHVTGDHCCRPLSNGESAGWPHAGHKAHPRCSHSGGGKGRRGGWPPPATQAPRGAALAFRPLHTSRVRAAR